jgi:hypothetical protein
MPTPAAAAALRQQQQQQHKINRLHSAGSDTDTIFTKNAYTLAKLKQQHNVDVEDDEAENAAMSAPGNERVELFSTDSEMDSFFKENESLVKVNNSNINNEQSTSDSPNKTDENTMNEDFEDDEFDRIVSEAQRLALFPFTSLFMHINA